MIQTREKSQLCVFSQNGRQNTVDSNTRWPWAGRCSLCPRLRDFDTNLLGASFCPSVFLCFFGACASSNLWRILHVCPRRHRCVWHNVECCGTKYSFKNQAKLFCNRDMHFLQSNTTLLKGTLFSFKRCCILLQDALYVAMIFCPECCVASFQKYCRLWNGYAMNWQGMHFFSRNAGFFEWMSFVEKDFSYKFDVILQEK